MVEYNGVYYLDKDYKTAVKLATSHSNKITFHENCEIISAYFAQKDYTIYKITLSDKIRGIGAYAFHNCKGLEIINFNEKLETIEKFAFANTSVKTVSIPKSVNTIKEDAFRCSPKLKTVNFDKDSHLHCISKNVFDGCALKEVILPDNIKHIESKAFANNTKLKRIYIGENVNQIDCEAFSNCDNIEKIDIDKFNVNYDNRFNCNAIVRTKSNEIIFGNKNTTIPDTIKSIGEKAFYFSLIKKVNLPESVLHIKQSAFEHCFLEKITLPKKLKDIDNFAFSYCTSLKEISIPDNVEFIGNSAFCGCLTLHSVHFPTNTKEIEFSTFKDCHNLKNVYNIEHVKRIKENAFNDCLSLNHITLGKDVKYIGNGAFGQCIALSEIELSYNKDIYIDKDSFTNSCILREMFKEKNYFAIGGFLLKVLPVREIKLEEGIKEISEKLLFGDNTIESLILPSSLLNINAYAFMNCKRLEYVQFNEGLERIEHDAFNGTAIRSLTLPTSIKSIGQYAFADCCNLTSVWPFDFKDLESLEKNIFSRSEIEDISFFNAPFIPHSAFNECENLKEAYIPHSVKSIQMNAFEKSNVERLILHNALEDISYLGDMPSIKEIVFPGHFKDLVSISDPENLKVYGAYIKTLENLEELIDYNCNLKKLNKMFKDKEKGDISER